MQIVGGPPWLDTDFFDINGKAADNTPQADIEPMLRALLADRFTLRVHIERREMPVYALVPVRSDGRLGLGMRRTTQNCGQLRADGQATPGRMEEFPVCASRLMARALGGAVILEIAEGGITVPSFIAKVSSYVDRFVIDSVEPPTPD